MRTCIFIPPVKKPVGGVAVLLQMGKCLHQAGYTVTLVRREGRGPYAEAAPEVPTVPLEAMQELGPTAEDIWLVPEGWVNALAPGLSSGARCVVYCQNYAYLFSSLPPGVHWKQLKASFMAVSDPTARFIEMTLGVNSPVLRPGIDLEIFTHPRQKPEGPVRIAYMPRKNKALVERIRLSFQARMGSLQNGPEVEWAEIEGLDREGVAQVLQRSHVFLAAGFPEGCPLPPLEAMACGCFPVGFAGFGGFDYMRSPTDAGMPWLYAPWFPLRETPWKVNGLWVADADVPAAALALERAVIAASGKDDLYAQVYEGCLQTAAAYSEENHKLELLSLWQRAKDQDIFI